MPRKPAQSALDSIHEREQNRSGSPSECGSSRSSPGGFGNIGRGLGCANPWPWITSRNTRACSRAMPAWSDAQLKASTRDQVGGTGVLGHVERVLVAHVDHAGPDLDPTGPGPDGGEQ